MDGRQAVQIVTNEFATGLTLDSSNSKLYFISMMQNYELKSVNYFGENLKTITVRSHHKDLFKHTIKVSYFPAKRILMWNGDRRLVYGHVDGDEVNNVTLAFEAKKDQAIEAFVAVYKEIQPQIQSKCQNENFCHDDICIHVPNLALPHTSKFNEVCLRFVKLCSIN